MESANAKYTDKRQTSASLPDTSVLTPQELLATRGMVLWDKVEKTEDDIVKNEKWEAVAKKKSLKRGMASK